MSTATLPVSEMGAFQVIDQAKALTVKTVSDRQLCQCGCGLLTSPYKTTAHGHRAGQTRMFIRGHSLKRESNPSWSGGRRDNGHGYTYILYPEHHRASVNGYVFEHILIAEKALGRRLSDRAQVHHVNGIRSDNSHENLVICEDQSYHQLLHRRQRAYAATGNPDSVKCVCCKKWGMLGDGDLVTKGNGNSYHRACNAAYERSRRQKGGR